MTKEVQKIECPKCGTEINVNNLVYHQMHEQVQKEFQTKLSDLEKQKDKISEAVEEGVKKQLTSEKSKLEKKIKAQITEETSAEIQSYQEQLKEKTSEIKGLNKLKSELSQVKREKDELKEKIEAEAEEKLNSRISEEKTKIRNQVEKETELKFAEKDSVIEKLKEQTKDMQRKLEQGSMQVQGEVQETAMEDYLRECFPLDTINEVKKGARGADSLQIVNTRTRQNCGSIYYESKRTQSFSPAWIEKFKEDMRSKNATIGAIVTDALPKDMKRFGQKDGIWICTYHDFKGLCYALRETVILYSNAIATQENKESKMELLYDFLTSNEFKMQIEAIVEGFSQLDSDLASERRSMEMIWKKREKQIQKVLKNTIHFYGHIKAIAGNAVGNIRQLELPASEIREITQGNE